MKTIMIIGAGRAQVPLIEAARKENYHTVVCDADPDAPGVSLAHEYLRVSTKDRSGLLEVAKERNIDGITANSDYAMCDVAYIANTLGLVGNPEHSIKTLSSKGEFRSLQKREGLFAPDCFIVDSVEQIKDCPLSFPIMIKPDESAGSRGITRINRPDEEDRITCAIRECSALSRNGKVIAEEFIHMPANTGIEGEIFIHNNEILWDGLFLAVRSEQVPILPMTYVFPLPETEERINRIKEALTTVFQSAGIVHGEYNIEMYFTDKGEPFIIEINPRQGGYDLPRYVRQHCGIDYYKLLVTTSMGDNTYLQNLKEYQRSNRYIIHHMLFPRKKGYFRGIHISDTLKDKVCNTKLYAGIGEELQSATDSSSRIGYIDLEFSDPEEQLEVGRQIEKYIHVETEQV